MDRSDLISFIDQLVSVQGGDQVRADGKHPVLVIEGSGGSGRSTFLQSVCDTWAGKTPTAWIDPREIDTPDARGLRPVLLEVLLGLSAGVEGYKVRFPRVIAAYIAMKEPILDEDPGRAAEVMRDRLVGYGDRARLIDLVGGILGAAPKAAQDAHLPWSNTVAAIVDAILPGVLDRFRRSSMGITGALGKAVEWFRHQDRGLNRGPLNALVHLSRQAAIDSESVRLDVDELLITALLADLRESLSDLANRPCNALIVIDNGDMPAARAFTTALVRVQGRAANPPLGQPARPPDPVVMVTSSGGVLVEDLIRMNTQPTPLEESRIVRTTLPDIQRYATWLPVQMGDFTDEDVRTLAQGLMWPPRLGSGTISHLTYRLTGGHAAATRLVLRALEANPAQLRNLGQVLRGRSFTAPDSLEQHLLDRVVSGLRASGTVDKSLRNDLIILAAARDVTEAESLTELLHAPTQEILLTSRTLWSGHPVTLPPLDPPRSATPTLSPLVRYLGLRALASQTDDITATWDTVFGTLRDRAPDKGAADQTGRLHHELALGHLAPVAAEFVDLLHDMADYEWLALLDHVTATPDPRWRFLVPSNAPARPTDHGDLPATVFRVVEGQHAASDPQLSDPETLQGLYGRLSNDFRHLAGNSRVFLKRADYYARLATALS